jgi:hypothetical protein
MILKRQSKGTLNTNKQTLSPLDFAKQVLHWIVYVFTSEQVYSNDGSKIIIYGGSESQYDDQAKGSLNKARQAKGSLTKTRQSKGSLSTTRQTKINENFTKQLKIDTNFTRED